MPGTLRAGSGRVTPELFRGIMSRFPAGVTVVTAYGDGGEPRGLTVSAFCPVSLSPPLVLVCVDRESETLPAIRSSGGYTVNFLAAEHADLALRFASKGAGKFEGLAHRAPGRCPQGGPVLEGCSLAYVACRLWRELEAGDHLVLVGLALEGASAGGEASPLVYGERRFAGWRRVLEAAS
ncbi:flavin reductase-like, FMN-binding protein [Rubrobacter xylanophilus DSM 9941]|uniref:Flavin reductase-like, FMN-binding protein n=1 Tax=Rubrobacter xylanophilus (strain DSM 9941 / JCM 11954 / NBRC 16129 / PRD-1) TaxID=266117 RepID=Q1AV38_RUBXD|nr:flavin reductase family protein [Rubrobacter xylanophilus]ABG04740.1 flavin reductase-like, FMN-binding protein [Rubrobacter xylanophilus DSM 9941]